MSAWGVNTFENDTACDWSYGLDEVEDLTYVRDSLNNVLELGDDYLDSDPACEALAASEVIARLNGKSRQSDAFTESIDKWVETHPMPVPPDLVQLAMAAIDRILTPPSELLDLWEVSSDSSNFSKWKECVMDLRARVAGD